MTGLIFYLCGAAFIAGVFLRLDKAPHEFFKGKFCAILVAIITWPVMLGYIVAGIAIDQEKKEKEKDGSGKADN